MFQQHHPVRLLRTSTLSASLRQYRTPVPASHLDGMIRATNDGLNSAAATQRLAEYGTDVMPLRRLNDQVEWLWFEGEAGLGREGFE